LTVLPDVIAPGLSVLFCGINPGLLSAARGQHFARPGNRFWPALHQSGFTPRLLHPSEQFELLPLGLGITNMVARPTARADELTRSEFVQGAGILTALAEEYSPQTVAIVGITAFRMGFDRPKATIGLQPETLGPARLWVLPNPSGLNAHYQLPALAAEFGRLRAVSVSLDSQPQSTSGEDDLRPETVRPPEYAGFWGPEGVSAEVDHVVEGGA
jgi:double-stranded uracil-DNA glycosylase